MKTMLLTPAIWLFFAVPLAALAEDEKPAEASAPRAADGTVVAQAPTTPAPPAQSNPSQSPPPSQEPTSGASTGASKTEGAAQAKGAPPPATIKIGGISLTPYGTISVGAHWNSAGFGSSPCNANCETTEATGGSTSGDYPNYANGMPGSFIMSARQSRFGVNVDFPTEGLPGVTLKGVVEFDFAGGFTSTSGNSYNWYVPTPRLRHANSTLKFKLGDAASASILAGQAYGLIAPLFAVRPNYQPALFQNAGNLWNRAPQFRVFGDFGGDFQLTWAVAMLAPLTNLADATTTQLIANDFGPGERARMPDFEARVGVLAKQNKKTIADVGLSGHVGRQRYVLTGADKDVDNWATAIDVNLNFTLIALRGEAFAGENMGSAQGHFPGASPVTGVRLVRAAAGPPDQVHPIHTHGGWAQLIVTPVDPIQVYGGYGFEQPNDTELGTDLATTAPTQKLKNAQIQVGASFSPTKAWFAAFEYIRTMTTYAGTLPNGLPPDLAGDSYVVTIGATL